MKTFEMICRERANVLGEKYKDEKGINRAMYERDNIEDIIEELADASNIKYLYSERIANKYTSNDNYYIDNVECCLNEMTENNNKTANRLLSLIHDLGYPSELRKENIIRVGIDDNIESQQTIEQEIVKQHEQDKVCLENKPYQYGIKLSHMDKQEPKQEEQKTYSQIAIDLVNDDITQAIYMLEQLTSKLLKYREINNNAENIKHLDKEMSTLKIDTQELVTQIQAITEKIILGVEENSLNEDEFKEYIEVCYGKISENNILKYQELGGCLLGCRILDWD